MKEREQSKVNWKKWREELNSLGLSFISLFLYLYIEKGLYTFAVLSEIEIKQQDLICHFHSGNSGLSGSEMQSSDPFKYYRYVTNKTNISDLTNAVGYW